MAPPTSTAPDHATVDGSTYIQTLSSYIRQHETKLADFVRRKPPATVPTWTSILTLGVISSETPVSPKPPLILRFDPHHLYYLLLKFDEAGFGGTGGIGSLDVRIEGGVARPMSVNYGELEIPRGGMGLLPGLDSDNTSLKTTFSAVSTFSLGSGWWGTGGQPVPDEKENVRYLYSSCTKLPALRLVPFTFSSSTSSSNSSPQHLSVPILTKPVKDFQDCPPPNTAVPLYAFKNLQSLILEELDPRGFLGWDVLSTNLRSLEVRKSGIEDIGELICDAVVEDVERRKKGQGGVGEERRRRQEMNLSGESAETSVEAPQPSTSNPAAYPVPPPAAWSRLRHLSLSHNSLTFIPSAPLTHLQSLTSLDLSSNLLISIPPGLAHLHSLTSLNLSDNMIESLLGVSKALGNVSVINLSHNRIDNLSGLDRIFALERLDLRGNRLRESLEISRLANLPCLSEVWIESNPFSKSGAEGGEEHYRLKCFGYFEKEGKLGVMIDGTSPGSGERRTLDSQKASNYGRGMHNGRRSSAGGSLRGEEAWNAGQAKVVGRRVVTTPHGSRMGKTNGPSLESMRGDASSSKPLVDDTEGGGGGSPPETPVRSPHKPKKRKPRRIVDLDGLVSSTSIANQGGGGGGDVSGTDGANSNGGGPSDSDQASSPALNPTRSHNLNTSTPAPLIRHLRFPTSPATSSPNRTSFEPSSTTSTPSKLDTSLSLGASTKKSPRRDRISPSLYEHSTSNHEDPFSDRPGTSTAETSAAFRKKIEALRSEVGESWLSVLGEREMTAERSKSGNSSAAEGKKEDDGLVGKAKAAAGASGETAEEGEAGVKVVKVVKGKGKKKKSKAPS